MQNILVITTSIFGEDGQSSQLINQALDQLATANPEARVTIRNLASNPVPHLSGERFGAFLSAADNRTAEQQAVIDFSDQLIEELRTADAVILGVPMYNFGIPSGLKAYFDHIARAGVTFRYTENGPEGLLADRPVYIIATRGGIYAGTELDTQTPYLRTFLGFLGLQDLNFVYAEGLNMGDDSQQKALQKAAGQIAELMS
ncbi:MULTISPECIES: FMN-dependent NADH-azoreductase [Marinobacter]|uniref:FMN dependent NADH:quinone oxidoreductase n=1 Tax=Marinobacter profundi TaxID=2666256 RepID=A0A2G1UI13_9GAMM|nr:MULTISPECIES: FMN-dependent NADH-azoreductase [Marinobacter]MBD3658104.1 FMN-dependent NADH-azoreductase [Marinobacter sp.]PHQ14124.1 FMN-dependent NADH-azoreductase [Marinobacter profundi]